MKPEMSLALEVISLTLLYFLSTMNHMVLLAKVADGGSLHPFRELPARDGISQSNVSWDGFSAR